MQQPIARRAVQTIVREHRQLSVVVNGMSRFVQSLAEGAHAPPPIVMRAMLYYIRDYPERVHHPREDKYLFARLRSRTDELHDVIDQLEAQHVEGEARVRDLERALTRYELIGQSAAPALQTTVDEYAAFYSRHRLLEEDVILPAALRCLTAADWMELDEVFGDTCDPFSGSELQGELDRLYKLIVSAVPAS
ncbi:hemerythrin domain-containing protein [Paraburkholderia phymatum]|uniref:Hemerythrin HHE cation binding domain protein n=1 Tax=Paraburkholderia phymatum (strain DSM 17167 / CIP 108236 / LMG 21445 / STM815) TaxID=391038 RepID=B2JU25_PARP8|nr:hemerythrin domain-containing protein [Paraburkholderia phymatum]ACC76078.1 Hemerythrin HHE cation binding domain protein [Paraburkholderia phymatum STM815]